MQEYLIAVMAMIVYTAPLLAMAIVGLNILGGARRGSRGSGSGSLGRMTLYTGVEGTELDLSTADTFRELTSMISGSARRFPDGIDRVVAVITTVTNEGISVLESHGYQVKINITDAGVNDYIYSPGQQRAPGGTTTNQVPGLTDRRLVDWPSDNLAGATFKVEVASTNDQTDQNDIVTVTFVTSNEEPPDWWYESFTSNVTPRNHNQVTTQKNVDVTGDEDLTNAHDIESTGSELTHVSVVASSDDIATAAQPFSGGLVLSSEITGFGLGRFDIPLPPLMGVLGTESAADQGDQQTYPPQIWPILFDLSITSAKTITAQVRPNHALTQGVHVAVEIGYIKKLR